MLQGKRKKECTVHAIFCYATVYMFNTTFISTFIDGFVTVNSLKAHSVVLFLRLYHERRLQKHKAVFRMVSGVT